MKKMLTLCAAVASVIMLMPEPADAGGRFKARGARTNDAGGVTAGSSRGVRGAERGAFSRRGYTTDGQGNGKGGRGGCANGYNGAGCRGSKSSVNSDGSFSRQSGARYENANGGSASRDSSFDRNADGTYAGQSTRSAAGERGTYDSNATVDSTNGYNRNSTATNENGTRTVNTDGQRGEGGSRTVSCTDAAGHTITCPTR